MGKKLLGKSKTIGTEVLKRGKRALPSSGRKLNSARLRSMGLTSKFKKSMKASDPTEKGFGILRNKFNKANQIDNKILGQINQRAADIKGIQIGTGAAAGTGLAAILASRIMAKKEEPSFFDRFKKSIT